MRKIISILAAIVMLAAAISTAAGEGYTLREKMGRQLQVGSGLMGTFVVHGNLDAEPCAILSAVQNAEYGIFGIQSEGNAHYGVFQHANDGKVLRLADYRLENGEKYLSSDLFNSAERYQFPHEEHILSLLFKTEGENPSILSEFLGMFREYENNNEIKSSVEALEKQAEMWIAGFAPETTIHRSEDNEPQMTQVFTVSVEDLFKAVTEMVRFASQNETIMNSLRSILSEEQIALYFNPNLDYYYLDAMKSIDLTGDIVFSRTVSTMGKLLNSSLRLPLSEKLTGYASVNMQSEGQRSSILLEGNGKLFFVDFPSDMDLNGEEYRNEIYLTRMDSSDKDKNISVKVQFSKEHEAYNDSDNTGSHEKNVYKADISRDCSRLPENVSQDDIPEMDPISGSLEFHYSSKLQLNSPTILEVSFAASQGEREFELVGEVRTTSPGKIQTELPWALETGETAENAVNTDTYTTDDFIRLLDTWIKQGNEKILHTPEEIRLSGQTEEESNTGD